MAERKRSRGSSSSLGRECAAYGCSARDYYFENEEKIRSDTTFFLFPSEPSRKQVWCSLIKRQDGRDGFKVTKNTVVCEKHFEEQMIYRPPGGTKKRLLPDAKPNIHAWNDGTKKARKEPTFRPSPKKKFREPKTLDDSMTVENEPSELDIIKAELQQIKDENTFLKQYNTQQIQRYNKLISEQSDKVKNLETQNNDQKCFIKDLELQNQSFSVKSEFMGHVLKSDESCNYYTGFPSLKIFQDVLIFLDAGETGQNIILYNYKEGKNDARGRRRCFSPLESFVLTLVKLRRNFGIIHLSYIFNASEGTISNTFNTWINFMYIRLGSICIWPTREQVQKIMPESMKQHFANTRCIIDCLEIKVAVPTSLRLHKMLYSDYKSHTTVKILVGIAPGGGFTFISSAYPGSISDKNIVVKSGFLRPELWQEGDAVMADRGFTIAEYLKPMNVELIIPSFLQGREQFTELELVKSQQIARERIHVERMIQRLKCYHIFDRVMPLNMAGSLNQIITVAALLSNFQDPILKDVN